MLFLPFLLLSCGKKRKIKAPDVSAVQVNLELVRLDTALSAVEENPPYSPLPELKLQYPGIFECYFTNILGIQRIRDTQGIRWSEMAGYLRYPGYRAAVDSVRKVFPDLNEEEKNLYQAFQYLHYYLPDRPLPKVFTFVSEYQYGAVTCADTLLGIGLDMYLGRNFTFYPAVGYPAYITRRMSREYLVRDAMMSLAQNDFGPDADSDVLLDRMIHQGKLLYFLDLTLPYTPDSIKITYTEKQLEWCEKNEREIWAYFLNDDRLFMNDRIKGSHYVQIGPSTMGMPPEAPGNIGSWVGWQIVRKFMDENPDVGIRELMSMRNGQKLLQLSGYKP